jgi:hypothetical protein
VTGFLGKVRLIGSILFHGFLGTMGDSPKAWESCREFEAGLHFRSFRIRDGLARFIFHTKLWIKEEKANSAWVKVCRTSV